MITILKQNQTYQATITLSGFEIIGTNKQVVDKLIELGFKNVSVNGSGKYRNAIGTWSKPDQPYVANKYVTDIKEI